MFLGCEQIPACSSSTACSHTHNLPGSLTQVSQHLDRTVQGCTYIDTQLPLISKPRLLPKVISFDLKYLNAFQSQYISETLPTRLVLSWRHISACLSCGRCLEGYGSHHCLCPFVLSNHYALQLELNKSLYNLWARNKIPIKFHIPTLLL